MSEHVIHLETLSHDVEKKTLNTHEIMESTFFCVYCCHIFLVAFCVLGFLSTLFYLSNALIS